MPAEAIFTAIGQRVILSAHRGDRAHCPENTMPAMLAAAKMGADMIETDIHQTKDKHLVIMHDRSVARTTNGTGFTNEMTLSQLRALDAGSWKAPEFAATPIPTVEEFCAFLQQHPQMWVNWELKDYPDEVGEAFAFETADRLIEALEFYGLGSRAMLNSFSNRVLGHIVQKYGRKYLIHGQGIYHCPHYRDEAAMAPEALFDWVCLWKKDGSESPVSDKENFDYCLSHALLPCVCIPDEMETYRQAIAYGTRMFTSNDPMEGMRILRALGQREG